MLICRWGFVLCFILMLTACAPQKPLTQEQQQMIADQKDCEKDASEIADPPHSSMNPSWDAYFTMCMKTRYNYTNEQIRSLWY